MTNLKLRYENSSIKDETLLEYDEKIKEIHEELAKKANLENEFVGWLDLPVNYDKKEFERIKKAAEKIRRDSDVLVVIGIGGSYLGARAVIESLTNNPRNYEKNVTKLQVLSHRSWCTKAPYASTLLMYANFHLLMENGKPKAIIRVMEDGVVEEIQSIGNRGPIKEDLPAIEEYIQQQKFTLDENTRHSIKEARISTQ